MLAMICSGILPMYAASSETIPDSTPAAIEPTAAADETELPTAEAETQLPASSAAASATPGSASQQGNDSSSESTGNSGGQIAFMLIIFVVCLFFIVEAIVSWLRKKKNTEINPENDWRRR